MVPEPDVLARVTGLRAAVGLDWLEKVFEGADLEWAVLKGPILSRHYYSDELRPRQFSDLDALVAPHYVDTAVALLTANGATLATVGQHDVNEIALGIPGGLALDLHWDLLQHRRSARHFRYSVEEVLGRRRQVELRGGRTTWALDDIDNLLQVSLHAVVSGADDPRWWLDVDQIVRTANPSWREVVSRARAWRADLVLAVSIERAVRAHATPVPDWVVPELIAGRSWIKILDWSSEHPRLSDLLVGNTRSTTLHSAASALGSVRGRRIRSWLRTHGGDE